MQEKLKKQQEGAATKTAPEKTRAWRASGLCSSPAVLHPPGLEDDVSAVGGVVL